MDKSIDKDKKYEKKTKTGLFSALSTNSYKDKLNGWYIDTCCSKTMSSKVQKMNNYSEQEGTGLKITVANNENLLSTGSGNMSVRVKVKSGDCIKTINKVMHVPNLSVNLLSVSEVIKKGYIFLFYAEGCKIYDKENFEAQGEVKMTGSEVNGIYRLDTMDSRSNAICSMILRRLMQILLE